MSWPGFSRENITYGNSEWARKFGTAEWSPKVTCERIQCPVTKKHNRSGERLGNLEIVLPSYRVSDFVWTCKGEAIVQGRVIDAFLGEGLTGIEPRSVSIGRVKRKGESFSELKLFELNISSKPGKSDPISGIRIIESCDKCKLRQYSSFQNGISISMHDWDRSDFFSIEEYPRFIFVSEKAADVIRRRGFANCCLIPSEKLVWPEGVFRPEEGKTVA